MNGSILLACLWAVTATLIALLPWGGPPPRAAPGGGGPAGPPPARGPGAAPDAPSRANTEGLNEHF
jgi:hypothetical protein